MIKVVNSLWIGKELSPLQLISINSFLAKGFKYDIYLYDDVINIPSEVNILDGNNIIDESEIFFYKKGFNEGSPSAFSNLFRYELLFQQGGLWVDTDMVLLKDFDLSNRFVFVSELDHDGNKRAATGLMYTKYSKEEIFEELIDEINSRDRNILKHGEIGPNLFDYKVKELDLMNYVLEPNKFGYPNWDETYKFVDGDEISEESIGIHLWNARWKFDGLDPYGEYDKNCIYEKLKRKYL